VARPLNSVAASVTRFDLLTYNPSIVLLVTRNLSLLVKIRATESSAALILLHLTYWLLTNRFEVFNPRRYLVRIELTLMELPLVGHQ